MAKGHDGPIEAESSTTRSSHEIPRTRKIRRRKTAVAKSVAILSILAAAPSAMAQSCVSLAGSKACPAFNSSSITTGTETRDIFSFLQFVKDTESFDQQLASYVKTGWPQRQYQTRLGCSALDLTNTTDLYARFSTSVICNSIIQLSKDTCGLSDEQSRPLCADTCAQYAQSESRIVDNSDLCADPTADTEGQIRADFTWCALPASSLKSGRCVDGIENEQENCGFGDSTLGLCGYCAAGGMNSTDTCCYNSGAESRCAGVVLPVITTSISLATDTPTPSASETAAADTNGDPKSGLSRGAIAGIVVGSIAGLALLIGLIFLLLLCMRRRRPGSKGDSVFNQPSPVRRGPGMAQNGMASSQAPPGFEVLPGGRIARMSALEGHSGDSPPRGGTGSTTMDGATGAAAGYGAAAAYGAGRNKQGGSSSSSFGDSPNSDHRGGVLRPPPTGRRHGSLSSNSVLGEDPNSPVSSGNGMSSPNMASQQSEQLPYFKDYYSQDEIHPGDKVATLWAYQPRAGDEFMLERGDMLKVVGIWDDGWATGVMVDERADEWEAKRNAQRDSGISNASSVREASPPISGEIKAFPLVCVCLPEHWKKTIEGDGSTETNSSGAPPMAV